MKKVPIQDLRTWAHDLDMVVVMLEDPRKKQLASLVCSINKLVIACPAIVKKCFFMKNMKDKKSITTLALGSQPRQGLAKVWAKNEAW